MTHSYRRISLDTLLSSLGGFAEEPAERSRVLEGFCPVTCNRWFGTIPKSANVYGPFSFSVWGTPPRAQI